MPTKSSTSALRKIGLILAIVFSVIILMPLVSCVACVACTMRENIPLEEAIPWGVWESYDPPMVLHISPEYNIALVNHTNAYPGILFAEDKEIKLHVTFHTNPGMIGRYRAHWMTIQDINFYYGSDYFRVRSRGDDFEVRRDGRLRLRMGPATDSTAIFFHRLETYDPIDLNDWLAP